MRGLSPLRAGLAVLPGTLVLFFVSAASAPLMRRFAPGLLLTVGLVLVAVGVPVMAIVGPHSSWTAILPGLLIAAVGTGIINPASAALGMTAGPPEDSGLLAGAMDTFRYGGIAVGVALFGALLPAGAAAGLGSASAFVTGFHHAMFVGCGISLAGALAVVILIGTRRTRAAVVVGPDAEELADAPIAPGR